MPRKKGQPHKIDITGQRFGRWSVIGRAAGSVWFCRCDCGTERAVTGSSLKLGTSTSCGCYSRERTTTHGMEHTRTYNCWAHMLDRCRNPRSQLYPNYGGRGISVCSRWKSFEKFYADMGDMPDGKSLDRINNDGDYKPSNCRWATVKQQSRNRRRTPTVEFSGRVVSVSEFAEIHGVDRKRVLDRIRRGLSPTDAVSKKRYSRWDKLG